MPAARRRCARRRRGRRRSGGRRGVDHLVRAGRRRDRHRVLEASVAGEVLSGELRQQPLGQVRTVEAHGDAAGGARRRLRRKCGRLAPRRPRRRAARRQHHPGQLLRDRRHVAAGQQVASDGRERRRRLARPRRRARRRQARHRHAFAGTRLDDDHLGDQAGKARGVVPPLECLSGRGRKGAAGLVLRPEGEGDRRQLAVDVAAEAGGIRLEPGPQPMLLRLAHLADPAVLQRGQHEQQDDQPGD